MAEDTRAPLFSVSNHHTPGCGDPPRLDGDAPRRYHGYFENQCGEQAIFQYDEDSGEGTLRLGDAGWEAVYRVVDGRAVLPPDRFLVLLPYTDADGAAVVAQRIVIAGVSGPASGAERSRHDRLITARRARAGSRTP